MKINKELLISIVRLAADGAHYNEMEEVEDELLVLYDRLQSEPVQLSNASGKGYDIPKKPETSVSCYLNDRCDTCRSRRLCRRFERSTDFLPYDFIDIPEDLDEVIE